MKASRMVLGALVFAGSAFAQYTIIEIPCGDGEATVGGLTDRGVLVADCFVQSNDPGLHEAFLPFVIGKSDVRDLGFLSVGLIVRAAGINKHQEVIANRFLPGELRAYLWSKGEVNDLGTFGGAWSAARGINDNGDVAGSAALLDGTEHAFLYRRGTKQDLGVFGAARSEATAINNQGQIVINRTFDTNVDEVTVAAILSDGVLQEIGSLGGQFTQGLGINSLGHVVGISQRVWPPPGGEDLHAFFFHDGQIEEIASASALPDTGSYTKAINDHDEIVGSWYRTFDAETVYGGFLFQNGVRTDISELLPPDSGWTINTADAINNLGQIAGTGFHNGIQRIYLLSPPKTSGK
jgi:probable HAF family extracellular repeat protein